MNLNNIYRTINNLHTIINFEDEISIIKNVMEVNDIDLSKNNNILVEILEMLELSHSDSGIFLVDNENYSFFVNFYDWLVEKNNKLNLKLSIDMIDTFLAKWDDDEVLRLGGTIPSNE